MTKYRNKKTILDGITFDSRKESLHYLKLKALEAAGKIHGLKMQTRFKFPINGENVRYVDSKREITYVADFDYTTSDGLWVVCDVKGFKTRDYLIKKALMMACHQVLIMEV